MSYWFYEQMIRQWYKKQEDEKLLNEMKKFMRGVAGIINKAVEEKRRRRTNKSEIIGG